MKRYRILFILSTILIIVIIAIKPLLQIRKNSNTAGAILNQPVIPTTQPISVIPDPTEPPTTPATTPLPVFSEEPRPDIPDSEVPLTKNEVRTLVALRATSLAVDSMPGHYSWEELRSCSTFASSYLKHLSFPVGDINGHYADHPDPFPFSSVITQVEWFRRNYPQYTHDAPLVDFLNQKLWSQIHPGDLIYLQNPVGHNGYNTYYHVVILVGYRHDGSPQFAELAAGMDNSSNNRSFEQVTSFYPQDANGWKVAPYVTGDATPENLIVTWVDPLAILNEGKLWRQDGVVTPNSPILDHFQQVVTINIENGTLAIFEKQSGAWVPVSINGRDRFYAVVGRRLPTKRIINQTFFDRRPHEVYDSDFGVLIHQSGIYQDTWTPQLIARLTGFERLGDFGGIGGSTDTSLLVPIIYDQHGKLQDYWDYSSFTFHLIPDVVNQDMLLRQDLLIAANDPLSPGFGPISKPQVYLSSGCVNFDLNTWTTIKSFLEDSLNSGNQIAVVFSYPHFDQNLLPHYKVFEAAFTNNQFYQWCDENCD